MSARAAGTRVVLGVALAAEVLSGCLPRHAITRRDEVEADTYAMDLVMDVTTEGLDVPPFRWHLTGNVAWSYTRTFRDGSMGHMVRFEGLRSTFSREGSTVEVPVPFADAVLEVRAFPDGEVLTVTGASAWTGEAGHLEVLDALWPALSPHLPESKQEAAGFTTSWPAWAPGGPRVRHRLAAAWTPTAEGWTYAGKLSGQGGNVEAEGTATGEVRFAKGDTRVLRSHTFAWSRTTRTRWGEAGEVRQAYTVSGTFEHAGASPAPPLDMPIASDDRVADSLPLRLRDGRVAEDAPSQAASSLPFVLLPDDLAPDARAALRARITGTW